MLEVSFVINSRFFSANEFSISCDDSNIKLNLGFGDIKGWILTKNGDLIYERGKTRFESRYKGQKLDVRKPTFKGYPLEFLFPEDKRISIFKPRGVDFNTSEYCIQDSNNNRLGELVVNTPFVSSTKTYVINIADVENTDSMLFVLKYMVCKLNDASGT